MATKHGLGRGLDALIRNGTTPQPAEKSAQGAVTRIATDAIQKNTHQPRRAFDSESMAELVSSVRERGILQPLLVRKTDDGYELIAGERRLRAATEAGLADVPAMVLDVSDAEKLEIALIENLQREDLNVLDEAEGYRVLGQQFGLTQEQISQRVGKARATVANALRVLELPEEIRTLLREKAITPGHAKLLTGIDIEAERLLLAKRTVRESLSVRNLERIVQRMRRLPRKPRSSRSDIPKEHLAYLSDKLHEHFGTSAKITPSKTYANGKKGRGSIEIDFYSNEELDRILAILGIGGD